MCELLRRDPINLIGLKTTQTPIKKRERKIGRERKQKNKKKNRRKKIKGVN